MSLLVVSIVNITYPYIAESHISLRCVDFSVTILKAQSQSVLCDRCDREGYFPSVNYIKIKKQHDFSNQVTMILRGRIGITA